MGGVRIYHSAHTSAHQQIANPVYDANYPQNTLWRRIYKGLKDRATNAANAYGRQPASISVELPLANTRSIRLDFREGADTIGPCSSLAPGANGIVNSGDKQVTTATLEGQAQWLGNNLCTLGRLGIRKTAYWSAADEYSLWSDQYWKYSPRQLAWTGYWGLRDETGAAKPVAATLSNYYMNGLGACPADGLPLPLILSLRADSGSFAVQGTQIPLSWGAMEFSTMSFNPAPQSLLKVYSCGDSKSEISSNLDVSCGLTYFAPASPGQQTITLMASNGTNLTSEVMVDVGVAPQVYSVQDFRSVPTAPLPIRQNSRVRIIGRGFTPGSRVQLQSGFSTVQFYDGDGRTPSTAFKIDQQVGIELDLNSFVAAGTWNLTVLTNDSTVNPKPTSNSVQVTIQQ